MRKRHAYLSVAAILLALGAVSYYTSREISRFQLNPDTSPLDLEAIRQQKLGQPGNSAEPGESQEQPFQPAPAPVALTPNASAIEKIESYIVTSSEFKSDPSRFTVTKNRKINLIIRADKAYSGPNGLEFTSPIFEPVSIRPGEEGVIEFKTESSFAIDVYKKGIANKLYSIPVSVK